MRLKLPIFVLGLAVLGTVPAMAQNNASTTPYYNTTTQAPMYYAPTANGMMPIYNNVNNAPPVPIDQLVAGKNAPSYNYNNNAVKPYNFGSTPSSYSGQGAMSAEQQAQAYQQQLLSQQQLQQQQQQQLYPNGQTGPMGVSTANANVMNGYPDLTQIPNSPFGNNTQAAPRQRKVIYKELNNPLKDPPRLFNPDQ